MNTATLSRPSTGGNSALRLGTFDSDEIRRIVQAGKQRGELRGATDPVVIEKKGAPATALGGIRTVWMTIDPADAKKWLENNFVNRPVWDDVVLAYARDMFNGLWVSTHQGIAFNDKDALIDGQHRLLAIVLSGVTIRMMVTFGLPSMIEGREMTTMDAVDRGRTRSVADQLTIQHGIKNGRITASICASLAGLCCTERTRRLSVGETLDIFRAFESPIEWVIMHRSRQHGFRCVGVLAAFAFALSTEEGFFGGATPIAQMYDRLLNGDGLRDRSPIRHLRGFLVSDDAKLLSRGTDRGLAELVLQAVHLERANKSVAKLEMATDGAEHFRKLQPERVAKIASYFRLPKTQPGATPARI